MSSLISFGIAFLCGCLLTVYNGDTFFDGFSFANAMVLGCLIFVPVKIIWSMILYPFYFSPLLRAGIPEAPGRKGASIVKPRSPAEVINWMNNIPNDGFIRYLDMFNKESVCITSMKALTEVFQTKSSHYIKRPKIDKILMSVLGNGLVTASGAEHKHQRKMLSPAFNFRVVKNLYPLFWTKASEMVALIKQELQSASSSSPSGTGKILMDDWAGRVALDIIGLAGFGNDFQSLKSPNTALNTEYRTAFLPNKKSGYFFIVALITDPAFARLLPFAAIRQMTAGINAVKEFVIDLITRRMSETQDEKIEHKDIISAAMKTGAFNAGQLLDQSMTLLAAGHETSAGALTWAILLLSQHTEIQTRLREEIRAHLPSPESGDEVTSDILDRLPYLDAVSKEAMRVYPPIPLIGRVAAQDTELCGVQVKKGTQVMVFPWAMNRCKKLWGEDAKEFKPERWLEGEAHSTGGAEAMAFMTFGTGARACIGKGFAQAENKALLAALIGSFEFTFPEGKEIEILYAITARIIGGFEVNATIVEGW